MTLLALKVVTTRVLVVLSGSFTSQTETGPIHEGYTFPNVESHVFTPNRPYTISAHVGYCIRTAVRADNSFLDLFEIAVFHVPVGGLLRKPRQVQDYDVGVA